MPSLDAPPAYSAPSSSSITEYDIPTPLDAQRALAPLSLISPMQPILGTYAVRVTGDSGTEKGNTQQPSHDVTLDSEFSTVSSTLYFETEPAGLWDEKSAPHQTRAISIFAISHNGSVALSIPRKQAGQRFNISCVCAHGMIKLWLPRNFDGHITAGSQHGSVQLEASVQRNSCIIPLGRGADLCARRYRIRPSTDSVATASSLSPPAEKGPRRGTELGEDVVQLTTNSGVISIGYADPRIESSKAASTPGCILC